MPQRYCNLWLRQMEVRMTWDHQGPHIDMRQLDKMAEQWK
ncbi:hypothetical protein MMCCUG48898_3743 [Mycobacteroides abscessus subsp. massiliense CCUG 48898 = JCM 15300]|nr:hypothetical protein MMCCUG48898_3743 [Mycobacteroides abscessus subsp. massiliense CCUG 48898 = JCM 15300]